MASKKICSRCRKEKMIYGKDELCSDCKRQTESEKMAAKIKNWEQGVEIKSSEYVFCPYCGNVIETCYGYEDFPELHEEGEHEIDCPECEKTFVMNTEIFYQYETRRKEC